MTDTATDSRVRFDDPVSADDTINAWLFFRSLKASKLLPPGDVAALERQATDESLATVWDRIRRDGLLTEYQFARVASGNPEGLVYGQYHVLGELGRGGCGTVYRAKHPLMDRTVALKVIAPELSNDSVVRDLFLREVLATTRLSHPHIAAAYHADVSDGNTFLVMEYVDGPTLHTYVTAGGPLPVPLACSVLYQTCQALQHAHEAGLIHRDIKPANILLSSGGPLVPAGDPTAVVVKVIDFGLAGHRAGKGVLATIHNPDKQAIGTPAFIAPEQIDDVHAADARADIYSLG
jgi:eukaryotic-like serine/threonine-protein kinase